MKKHIRIAMSDIHVHLTKEHVDVLFGKWHDLKNIRDLTIPGQFACEETVTVHGPEGNLSGVVVVGPERKQTQVEVSLSDAARLGLDVPLRYSGDISGSPGAVLEGPAGKVEIKKGVIAALRHVHMHTSDAKRFEVADGDYVRVRVDGRRAVVFENVLVRADEQGALEMHVDVEEGNAAGIENYQRAELLTE
ncbi:MAG: phosphate propanoyltransferase [Spirochaetales bacterium]|nr:phosphate propanoyltransferase [Spirochaetales bacterium]MCF7938442.1 phosphate propanoyltransferase [Spirochaetales bacterium]